MPLQPGTKIGPYEIQARLGEGGMGAVYQAHDPTLQRTVAIKVLAKQDEDASARLLQEARAASALNHPHICTVYEVGEHEGQAFIVMEHVEGKPLSALIRADGLPPESVIRYGTQIADALAHAHERGIVHRDLKSQNVVITPEGRAKVLDFGLAARMPQADAEAVTKTQEAIPHAGMLVGTLAYMAPEVLRGEAATARSDIWALGVLLYEMASGRLPFEGETAADLVSAVVRDTPGPLRTGVSPGLGSVLENCLSKESGRRYSSVLALQSALEALQAAASLAPPTRLASDDLPSIAVLPFVNMSDEQANEYFADGMTEDVIAQLSKIRALRVISRTSVMQLKKLELDSRQTATRLGVQSLLEGSVRRAGDRVRIVAQLIDAETDRQLWAETYDRDMHDIFAIQSDVAMRIATALQAELSADERIRLAREPTKNIDAYRFYLQGRQSLFRYTGEGIEEGLRLLQQAIAHDPQFALAHVGVAQGNLQLGMGYGAGQINSSEAYARAKRAVSQALAIDPESGDGHSLDAALKFVVDFDWRQAEQTFRVALELSPGSANAHNLYGLMLSALERYDEAITMRQRAKRLDPLAAVVGTDLATTLLRAGRFEEAATEAERIVQLQPGFPMGHSALGWAKLYLGQAADGIRELEETTSLAPENTMMLAQLGQAYGVVDRLDDARRILQNLEQLSSERYVPPYHMAYVYTGLREHERALDSLERAYDERAGGLYGIKGSFLFRDLRFHPRFVALLRKMNLVEDTGGVA